MREMKDSGIEWIGEIPKDWCVNNGKYVFNVYGMSVNDDFINDTVEESYKIKYYKVDNLNEATEQFYVKSNFANFSIKIYEIKGPIILVPKRGGAIYTNKVRIEKEACLFDSNIMGLTTNNNVRFMAYVLYGRGLSDIGDVTTIPQINKKHIDVLKIPVPSINEQEVIVEYLDTKCSEIDATAEDIQKEISLLEDYKKSVITEAVTKGLNPDAEMKDSGIEWIGEIPKHWKVLRIKNVGEYRNGLTYKPTDLTDENTGTLVLRSSNIQDGKISLKDNVYVSTFVRSDLKVKKGDILICSRNGSRELVGKNAIIEDLKDVTFGAFMMIFRCNSPKYLYYILNSKVFSYYLGSFFTSTINQLTGSNFGNMKIVYVSDKLEQSKIVSYLDDKCSEIDTLIADKKRQLDILAEYKKSIIYEYVTGKKEVPVNE